MPLDGKVIRHRAAQQAICLGAFAGEQMIGCLWLCLGPYSEDEVRCRFIPDPPDRCSWDFDVYLKPEFRPGLGFAKLWEEANRFLSGRGIVWSMSRISALNLHSIASHRRLGLRHLGSAIFLRFRRVQLALSSIRPHVHLSLSDASVPEFVLRAPDR